MCVNTRISITVLFSPFFFLFVQFLTNIRQEAKRRNKEDISLRMPSALFLLFPLLFVGMCESRNATTIVGSTAEINTFFGATTLQNKIMTYSRSNPESLFFQIPPTIKWERVVSLIDATTHSGQPLIETSGNALSTCPNNGIKSRAIYRLDPWINIIALVTDRTIYGSEMPYFKKYSKHPWRHPGRVAGGEKLDKGWRNGVDALAESESATGFWKLLDRKSNAFPHSFVSFRLPSRPTAHQTVKNSKSADVAGLLNWDSSSCDSIAVDADVAAVQHGWLLLRSALVATSKTYQMPSWHLKKTPYPEQQLLDRSSPPKLRAGGGADGYDIDHHPVTWSNNSFFHTVDTSIIVRSFVSFARVTMTSNECIF